MQTTIDRPVRFRSEFVGLIVAAAVSFQCCSATAEDKSTAPSSATRLKFLQQVLGDMRIESTEEGDQRELKFQMQPLLRYNDLPRGIADSMIFRLGTHGRPIAIVTAELYGRNGRQFLLNQEFLAIDDARVRVQRDVFRWQPPKEAALKFQPIESAKPPAE